MKSPGASIVKGYVRFHGVAFWNHVLKDEIMKNIMLLQIVTPNHNFLIL